MMNIEWSYMVKVIFTIFLKRFYSETSVISVANNIPGSI